MAKIPKELIERLKKETNLVRYVQQYTQLTKVGDGIWQGKCPNPKHNDSLPSFTVWEKEQSWACFGCHVGKKGTNGNVGSDIISFIEWHDNVDFRTAVLTLAKWANVDITLENNKEYEKNYKLNCKYKKDLYKSEDDSALYYLYERGLDDEDIDKWGIGYDSFSNRIVFPLYDRYNNIIGFNKRVIYDDKNEAKYKNSKNSKVFSKSNYLYGIHLLDTNYGNIFITEGSFDVILGTKYGVKNLMASLGTSFTEKHAEIIANLKLTPIIVFDSDDAGQSSTKKVLEYFSKLNIYCKVVVLPKGKDLYDMARELGPEINNYLEDNSVTAGFYVVKDILSHYQEDLYNLKLTTIPKLKRVINNVPTIEKKPIKNFIKDEINLSIDWWKENIIYD